MNIAEIIIVVRELQTMVMMSRSDDVTKFAIYNSGMGSCCGVFLLCWYSRKVNNFNCYRMHGGQFVNCE